MSGEEADDDWPETHWSMIGRTQDGGEGGPSEPAWRELVAEYRVPIETVLRRYLAGVADADDAVAGFFGYLFEGRILDQPQAGAGRFRAFIQAVARNYARHWKGRAARAAAIPLVLEPGDEIEPDGQAWLPTILDVGLARLREKDADLLRRFHGLGGSVAVPGEVLADEFETSRDAVYKRLHGARLRLREELGGVLRDLSADDASWRLELDWLEDILQSRLPRPRQD